MTHPATIETLIELRTKNTKRGDAYADEARELYARAAAASATAADHLSQAADFSGFLRQVDPDNSADYPDPRTPQLAAVAELRAIADLIERIGLPDAGLGVGIELNIHRVQPQDGDAFAAKVSAALADAEITRRDRYIEVAYSTDAPGISVEYALYLDPPREPQPRFVQATPAEVAEAYAAPMPPIEPEAFGDVIAAHNAQVAADFQKLLRDVDGGVAPGANLARTIFGLPVTVDTTKVDDVVIVGAEQRAALLEEHAADVAAADELERQGGEIDDAAERRLDQADADYPGDQAEALDDLRAAVSVILEAGHRVEIIRGKHRGKFGNFNGFDHGTLQVELEDGGTVGVAGWKSIQAAPLATDGANPDGGAA